MSLLKKGASHGYAPRNFLCCICNCLLTKNSSSLQIRVFNCGHATHLQCELLENEPSSRASSGCPVCMPKKNMQRSRNKSAAMEDGLVSKVSSRVQPSQRAMLYQHESDVLENSYRLQQVSRVHCYLCYCYLCYCLYACPLFLSLTRKQNTMKANLGLCSLTSYQIFRKVIN